MEKLNKTFQHGQILRTTEVQHIADKIDELVERANKDEINIVDLLRDTKSALNDISKLTTELNILYMSAARKSDTVYLTQEQFDELEEAGLLNPDIEYNILEE